FFFSTFPPPPISTLFPYTTLFRSYYDASLNGQVAEVEAQLQERLLALRDQVVGRFADDIDLVREEYTQLRDEFTGRMQGCRTRLDRKSTRLNSSHLVISYAVFCLK